MIPYKVIPRKSPKDKSVKYYANIKHGKMSEAQFVENIVQKNTCTRADVLAVIASIKEELVHAIRDGKNVTLPEIGTFCSTITSKGTDTQAKFTAANIQHLRVRFLPSALLRYDTSVGHPMVTFECVNPVTPDSDGE